MNEVIIDDERLERLRRAIGGNSFDDRFELEDEAGRGGMGIVYRAVERGSGRVLAVKVLGEDMRDHKRFVIEVSLLERMSHPAIVQYAHHGVTSNGRAYLAMEWLEGESLDARLRTGWLAIADAVALGARIASALAHAHARDILHRDLKPSNVMLVGGDPARATLIDFGIAKDLRASAVTNTGQLVGTPAYMAPERATGRVIDARADLFSLGCLLYECVAGEPPFEGTELVDLLAQVLMRTPSPVGARRPGVPKRFEAVIGALLEKQPEHRVGDAALIADELTAIAAALAAGDDASLAAPSAAFRGYEPTAAGVIRHERPIRHSKRRRWLVIVGIAGAVAGATVLARLYFERRSEPARLEPTHAEDYAWLYPGQSLQRGHGIWSKDGATLFVHQIDGDVALYHNGRLLWATATAGQATNALTLQSDGNLVLYSSKAVPVWNSETYGRAITGLAVQNDCNVVLYQNKLAVWETHTYGCVSR